MSTVAPLAAAAALMASRMSDRYSLSNRKTATPMGSDGTGQSATGRASAAALVLREDGLAGHE